MNDLDQILQNLLKSDCTETHKLLAREGYGFETFIRSDNGDIFREAFFSPANKDNAESFIRHIKLEISEARNTESLNSDKSIIERLVRHNVNRILEHLICHTSSGVRYIVAEHTRVITYLVKLMHDPIDSISIRAQKTLIKLGYKDTVDKFHEPKYTLELKKDDLKRIYDNTASRTVCRLTDAENYDRDIRIMDEIDTILNKFEDS